MNRNLHTRSATVKHSQPTPQTLNDNSSQKTSHHQCTYSKILDSTLTRNPQPTKNTGGQQKPLKHSQILAKQLTKHPVTNDTRPNKPATNQQHQSAEKKRTRHKEYVPSVKERQGLQNARQTPSKRSKSPSENSRALLRKSKGKHRRKKKQKTLRKNVVGKKQQKAQYAIYRGTAPRKAKRPTNAIIETTCCLGIPRVGGSS